MRNIVMVPVVVSVALAGCTTQTPTSVGPREFEPSSSAAPTVSAFAFPSPVETGRRAATRNELKLVAGCPVGQSVAQQELGGVRLLLVERGPGGFDLCVTTPNGRTMHPLPAEGQRGGYGVSSAPFPGGSYFRTDSLGHVFMQIYPGQQVGITVMIPDGDRTRLLGPFPGATVVEGSDPFVLNGESNDCVPSCADGRLTSRTLRWRAVNGDFS